MANYRLTAKGTLPGEQFNFGIHVAGAADQAAAVAADWAAALTSAWTDSTDGLEHWYTADVSIVVAHAAQLAALTQRQVDAVDVSVTLPGTEATREMMPHEVAVAVTTRGAAANKKDRGRFYLPPPSSVVLDAGLMTDVIRAHFAEAAAIIVNSLQAAGWAPIILHPDDSTTAIAGVDVGNVFDVQRRRRNKLIEVRSVVGV